MADTRRRALTPLESELRAAPAAEPGRPSFLDRLRRRRERRAPTTFLGAARRGVIRLAVTGAVASGIALLVDHWLHRGAALGFYIVGSVILLLGITSSTATPGRMWIVRTTAADRERRVRWSLVYAAVGAVVLAIGIAIEASS